MLRRNMKKEKTMTSIEISEIEQYARQLRGQEIRRIERAIASALREQTRQAGATLLSGLVAVGERLRSLFSWNPQRVTSADKV
jgi:hypothetical protein